VTDFGGSGLGVPPQQPDPAAPAPANPPAAYPPAAPGYPPPPDPGYAPLSGPATYPPPVEPVSGYPAPTYPAPAQPVSGYPVSGYPASPYGYSTPQAGYGMVHPGGVVSSAPRTNGLAIAAMTTSIVGLPLLLCYGAGVVACIVGAILGFVAKRQITERGDAGAGMANAGIIVGLSGVGLAVLGCVAGAILIAASA
jgi:hypothetical protein